VDEVGLFYRAQDQAIGTHLALLWKGRLRFTVPRSTAGQKACWRVFHPGRLGIPLRARALAPRLLGAVNCVEAEALASIRGALGSEVGLSCCRTGAPGVWSKDTILFLDKLAKPLYIVKAGSGTDVDSLLKNEAAWLEKLRSEAAIADHVPELVVHRSGEDLCFVAQSALSGKLDFTLGEAQLDFLRKLQKYSPQRMRYEDSILCRTFNTRLKNMQGLLTDAWLIRLDRAMRRIDESFARTPQLLVAAHNDFTSWNIRVQRDVASVFDWEYADDEQLPLFDPLHFILMPMALNRRSPARIIRRMNLTVQLCRQWFGKDLCYQAESQSLAYFVDICTRYLFSVNGRYDFHPVLDSYAEVIDRLCLL
jgi:hypothetical protein